MTSKVDILLVNFFIAGVFFQLTYNLGIVKIYAFDIAILAMVVVLLFREAIGKSTRPRGRAQKPVHILLVFLLFVLLSSLSSIDKTVSMAYFFLLVRIAIGYICFRAMFNRGSPTAKQIYTVVFFWFSILLLSGYLEMLTGSKIMQISRYLGVSTSELEALSLQARVSGTAANSNTYGAWLAIMAIYLLVVNIVRKKVKVGIVVLIAVMPVIIATLSRSAVICLISGILVLLLMNGGAAAKAGFKQRQRTFLFVIFISLLGGTVFFSMFSERGDSLFQGLVERTEVTFNHVEDGSDARLSQYTSFFDLLTENPLRYVLIGHGSGVYYSTLDSVGIDHQVKRIFTSDRETLKAAGVHNIALKFIVSFGFAGFICFAVSYWYVLRILSRAWRTSSNEIPIGLFCVCASLLLPAMVNTFFSSASMMPLNAMIFALTITMADQYRQAFRHDILG